MKNKSRVLIIKVRECGEDCPSFEAYVNNGYCGLNTSDWCAKKEKDIKINEGDSFPKFCPLKEIE